MALDENRNSGLRSLEHLSKIFEISENAHFLSGAIMDSPQNSTKRLAKAGVALVYWGCQKLPDFNRFGHSLKQIGGPNPRFRRPETPRMGPNNLDYSVPIGRAKTPNEEFFF